jgi:hypothetical protein
MRFYGIHPPFLRIRIPNHPLQIAAILKLLKLPACPLPVIATQSLGERVVGQDTHHSNIPLFHFSNFSPTG